MKITLSGLYYIGAQDGTYKAWLLDIYRMFTRLTPAAPPVGTKHHRKLVRWHRQGIDVYEACRRLQGLKPHKL